MTIQELYQNTSANKYNDNHEQFLIDVEEAFEFSGMPQKVKEKLHSMAWEQGHSAGYHEIANMYHEIVDLAKLCLNK